MTGLDPTSVPLIDRQAELHWLDVIAHRALDAEVGRLVTVVGPRGVGKSRVLSTFAQRCDAQGMTVLFAQCVGRAAEPLLPIRDALRPVLGTTLRSVRSALRRNAPELLGGVPVVGRFLAGLGRELAVGRQLGGDNPRGLYDILSTIVIKLGTKNGLCIIIEDVHVADPDTLSFLTYLWNKSRDCPALTIVSLPAEECENAAIIDYLSEWEEKGSDTLIIHPLERPYVDEYAAAVLGEGVLDQVALDFMFGFTGGNPLLLGESIRQLNDTGGDVTRLMGDPAEIPDRIRRLLQRRLQRLDERTRSFLDVTAVVGETSNELQPILGLLNIDEPSGLTTLDRACKVAMLHEDEDGHIFFTSELLHMVTYKQLRANQRRSLHLRAGEWYRQHHQFSEAAHHYEKAEDWHQMLPAAFRAAEAAEQVGLYRTALTWYRRIQNRADPAELFPRLAKALMVIGDWVEAERLLGALPSNDPRTLMLRSQLCFARGDVTGAADHATRALDSGAAENIDVLLCLANIHLYGGDFAQADLYTERALHSARSSGSINDQARCHIVRGACQLYNGDPLAAEMSFQDGKWLLDSCPSDNRDVGVYSALLGNRGFVEEVEQRWSEAERSHQEALRLRREVADAVGTLESTLAIGRVSLGQGNFQQAAEYLTEALRLADDLGEGLQQAKIIHAQGQLAAEVGDIDRARRLVEDARSRFEKCGTPYDVAYADLSLATILASARPRESIERLAMGRGSVEKQGFALLRRLFPELEAALPDRVHAGLLAYVAGDALGLPWEGRPPDEVRIQELDKLPARKLWPSGSTSDDTALTLLVAEHLADAGGIGDPLRFLETLATRSSSIPGLGPSTRQAIKHFIATGVPDNSGSNTNGAAMRALPVGWALPVQANDRRREWTLALTRVTHTGPDAVTAACVIAACASWAIEGAPPVLLAKIAAEEAAVVGADTAVRETVTMLCQGRWTVPSAGISLDPAETVAAVLYCCLAADGDLVAALRLAVSLGGDTDTVAALVGGLLGCQYTSTEISARLTWLDRVTMPASHDLPKLAQALTRIRLGHQ